MPRSINFSKTNLHADADLRPNSDISLKMFKHFDSLTLLPFTANLYVPSTNCSSRNDVVSMLRLLNLNPETP